MTWPFHLELPQLDMPFPQLGHRHAALQPYQKVARLGKGRYR